MKVTKITACVILLMFVSGCTLGVAGVDAGLYLMPVSILLLPLWLVVALAGYRKKNAPKRKARQEAFERELAARREARRKAETIIEVKLLDGGSSKQTRYGLKGAVVGGLLFNVPGAIIGAVIPKGTKQKQRFLVKYEDGHTEIKEAFPGSDECRELMRYVEW